MEDRPEDPVEPAVGERTRPDGSARQEEPGGGMGGGGVVTGLYPPPASLRPTLMGERWMVVGGHPMVAQVAATVFEQGGNAVDAGVAGGLAANVVEVDMGNFGGIAPILVRPALSSEVYSIGGVGVWGRDASVDAVQARFGDEVPLGAPVAIVPGAPGAWLTALERFGTWSLSEVAAPAIELANDGFPLDHRMARSLEIMGRGFRQWETSLAVYWPEGRPPRPGERLRQPALARLLETLVEAEKGLDRAAGIAAARRCFYEGDIAQRLVRFVRAGGGWLTDADVKDYTTEVAPAPGLRFRDWHVHTPSTWTQGPVLLQALGMLNGIDVSGAGQNSERYLHLVIESLKLAFSERERCYGDPRHVEVSLEELLSEGHLAELRRRIGRQALPNLPTLTPRVPSTTYLCTVDRDGGAFSAAPSDTLDGAPIIPELGIMCSPRGVQSRLRKGHPNAIAGGKRPCVTPAPAIGVRPGNGADAEVWAFGAPGGDVIVQAMLQAFLNVAVFEMTAQEAVEAPRVAGFSYPGAFHPHPEVDGRVYVEARIGPEVREALAARGHDVWHWPEYEFDAGSVGMAMDHQPPAGVRRTLVAAADPRRSAYAIGR